MQKRKVVAMSMAVLLLLGLSACGKKAADEDSGSAGSDTEATADTKEEDVELTVFAAASMTETLQEISEQYKKEAPNVTLTFNFDSSGTLKTQIAEGAACDVFISAAQKQMDELDAAAAAEKNPEGLDLVLAGSRVDLLNNEVVLCVPKDNPAGLKDFDDLADKLAGTEMLLAMGNSDVPVGQYTQKILTYYKLDEAALAAAGKISYGSNVKEVTTWVTEGSVAAGVVYATDAYSAGLTPIDSATEEMCGRVIYPAAVVNTTKHEDAAKAFLKYLQGDEAMAIFKNVGFTAV